MNMDRFTTMARQTLSTAQTLAIDSQHSELSPLHVLAAMLSDDKSIATDIIEHAGRKPAAISDVVDAALSRLPRVSSNTGCVPQTSPALINVLNEARKLASSMDDGYTSQEHLLLSLSDVPSPARDAILSVGLDTGSLRDAVDSIRKASGVESIDDAEAESSFE